MEPSLDLDTRYPYQVTINTTVEMNYHWDIYDWCRDNFGDPGTSDRMFRPMLSGSPAMWDSGFSTWLFVKEEHAALFKLRWL